MNAFRGRKYEDKAEIKGRGIEEKKKKNGREEQNKARELKKGRNREE
jgi:hypothetical protein